MKNIDLYKYITNNNIEWHWELNDYGGSDVVVLIELYFLGDFMDLFEPSFFDGGGYQCVMLDGYFGFYMNELCDYYDIDIEEVFPKEN